MELKVNDRVKVVVDKIFSDSGWDGFAGNTGVLVEIDGSTVLPYGVMIDGMEDEGLYHFEAEELEVIE